MTLVIGYADEEVEEPLNLRQLIKDARKEFRQARRAARRALRLSK